MADESFKYFEEFEIEQSACKFFLGSCILFYKIFNATLKGYIPLRFKGSMTTVSADILINEDGVIEKANYGKNTTDHLSFSRNFRFFKQIALYKKKPSTGLLMEGY